MTGKNPDPMPQGKYDIHVTTDYPLYVPSLKGRMRSWVGKVPLAQVRIQTQASRFVFNHADVMIKMLSYKSPWRGNMNQELNLFVFMRKWSSLHAEIEMNIEWDFISTVNIILNFHLLYFCIPLGMTQHFENENHIKTKYIKVP